MVTSNIFSSLDGFFNSNLLVAIFTIAAVFVGVWLNHRKKRTNAAASIVQEIRRMEDIINDYRQFDKFTLYKRIVATNSWNKNLHLFSSLLDSDQMNVISDLYSTGEFLDYILRKITDHTFEKNIKENEEEKERLKKDLWPQRNTFSRDDFMFSRVMRTRRKKDKEELIEDEFELEQDFEDKWSIFLDIAKNIQPVYHSTAIERLKKIAKNK